MESDMTYQFSFERLDVWQNAIALVTLTYASINKFPSTEKYALAMQMQRAVISVASNIAEGSTRASSKDQARFTEMAYGSLMELLNQFIIAEKLNYIADVDLKNIRKEISVISRQLNALHNTQKEKYNA